MNFKNLSLMLLGLSLSGHALMAATQATQIASSRNPFQDQIPFTYLVSNHHEGQYHWEKMESTTRRLELPDYIIKEIKKIEDIESDINREKIVLNIKKHIINRNASIFGGITCLAAGIGAYTKIFTNFNPRNRILGALATAATSAALVYHFSRSFFRSRFDISSTERQLQEKTTHDTALFDEHCTYLEGRMKQPDVLPYDKKRLIEYYANIEEKSPWMENARAWQAYQNTLRACRADNY